MPYNELITNTPIPELENDIMNFWEAENIFQKSVDQRPIDNQFVLYDGPPFATGLPHYGHILAHTIKDVLPRYQTMQGKRVERRFGWDCHGVPVEYQVEKALKLKGKHDIEQLGIAEFNEECRSIVQMYVREWRTVEKRLGRFVDMDNDYKTMDLDFMESVWSVFKKIDDKNLVYEGKKVVAYSPELGTALSDFEAKQNYKTIQDPEITLAFPLIDSPDTSLLVWTTTPWSVPANVAIALNKKIEYIKVTTQEGKKYILAAAALDKHFKPDMRKLVEPVAAESLIGARYQALFTPDAQANSANCFTLIDSDHVTDTDGTGMVHIACAFGEDDYKLGQKYQLPTLDYFDSNGFFKDELVDFKASNHEEKSERTLSVKGKSFKDADKTLIDFIKQSGRLFRSGTLHHEYPFCWRTDKPLMYRAVPSWYVKVTAIKDDIIANNQKINWYPDYVGKKRFNEWLVNSRDWAISRSRYWGTPIPVWRNQADASDTIVIGSIQELEALTGAKITDLHRHFIDQLLIEKDGKTYQRIPEVFDCWFESGAMPYAQAHYPFENTQMFEATFPADFIAEGLDQTRGWFYTLLVLSTALFNKPAFKNCMVNGILLGSDGKKMSKSKNNYPKIDNVFDKYGADALRFLLLGSGCTQAKEMKVSEDDINDVTRLVFIPALHIYKLFAIKANQAGFEATHQVLAAVDIANSLDQWLFFTTEKFKAAMKNHFDTYNLIAACQEVRNFIDLFSKLYVRHSKQRFKYSSADDVSQGLQCMHHALDTLGKCIAPLTPFMGEIVFQALYGKEKSVHLELWPQPQNAQRYQATFDSIELLRKVIRLGNTVRQEQRIELKQPLASANVSAEWREQLLPHMSMLKEALNVENITWIDGSLTDQLRAEVTLNDKALGPVYRHELRAIKAVFKNGYQLDNGQLTFGQYRLSAEFYSVNFKPVGSLCSAIEGDVWLTMDTNMTPALVEKGRLRSLLHEIQMLRKKSGLTANDRIVISVIQGSELARFMGNNSTEICKHTSADIHVVAAIAADDAQTFSVGEWQGQFSVAKMNRPVSVASAPNVTLFRPRVAATDVSEATEEKINTVRLV